MAYIRKNIKNLIDTGEDVHFSQKHYRPHHFAINKKRMFFTTEWTMYENNENDECRDIGINKKRIDVHVERLFDTWKDGNSY